MNYLSIDPGKHYHGVALVSHLHSIIFYDSIKGQDYSELLRIIARLIKEWGPCCVIYGYNDTKGVLKYTVEELPLLIRNTFNLPVFYQSEQFSTQETKHFSQQLRSSKLIKQKHAGSRSFRDGMSAVVIARRWIEACK